MTRLAGAGSPVADPLGLVALDTVLGAGADQTRERLEGARCVDRLAREALLRGLASVALRRPQGDGAMGRAASGSAGEWLGEAAQQMDGTIEALSGREHGVGLRAGIDTPRAQPAPGRARGAAKRWTADHALHLLARSARALEDRFGAHRRRRLRGRRSREHEPEEHGCADLPDPSRSPRHRVQA